MPCAKIADDLILSVIKVRISKAYCNQCLMLHVEVISEGNISLFCKSCTSGGIHSPLRFLKFFSKETRGKFFFQSQIQLTQLFSLLSSKLKP